MQGTGFESWHGQFVLRGVSRPWSALLNPSHFPFVPKTGKTGAYLDRHHVPGQQFSAVQWSSYTPTATAAVRPVDRLQVAGRSAGLASSSQPFPDAPPNGIEHLATQERHILARFLSFSPFFFFRERGWLSTYTDHARGWKVWVSNPGRDKTLFSKTSRPSLGPNDPPTQFVPAFFPRGTAAGALCWPLTSI